MGSALQGISTNTTNTQGPNKTFIYSLGMATSDSKTTEARSQITCRKAGTLSKMYANIAANSLSSASTTFRSRINGSNGNLTCSVSAGVTGVIEDTSNSDSLSVTDLYNANCVTSAGGSGTMLIGTFSVLFTATTTHGCVFGQDDNRTLPTTASTTYFLKFAGAGPSGSTTENNDKFQVDVAGTIQNAAIYLSANSRGTTSTFRSRVNNADGAQSVSVSAASTGLKEDTTNVDTLSVGDDINASWAQGTGAGSITYEMVSCLFINSTDSKNNVYFGGHNGSATLTRAASGTATFYPFVGGSSDASTSEARFKIQPRFSCAVSKMKVYVSANTYGGTGTMTSRKNGADGAQSNSITATTTGLFEDTTNTDSLGTTDDFNYKIIDGTSGSITIQWFGALMNSASALFLRRLMINQAVNRAATY